MSSTSRGGARIENDVYETPAWAIHRLLDSLHDKPWPYPSVQHPLSALYNASQRWLEPCAGRGNIITAVESWRMARSLMRPVWTAAEIRPDCESILRALPGVDDVLIGDWLARNDAVPSELYAVDLTNPPFALAMEFIRSCRPLALHTFKLLRINFLGSEERSDFIRETTPDLHILPNRPEFAMSVKCKVVEDKETADFNWPGEAEARRKKCVWKDVLPLTDARPTACPKCGGRVQISTTDSIEYAWFHWHPASSGRYTMLASTPKEERNVHRIA